MKKVSGFTAVEGLLILVIVGILVFTGYYVWNSHKKTETTASKITTTQTTTTQPADPTAEWEGVFSAETSQFSLKYPKTWSLPEDVKSCTGAIFLAGSSASSVGSCGSSFSGQIAVAAIDGDHQTDNELTTATSGSGYLGFKNISKSTVTIDGVKGEKQTGTSTGANIEGPPTLPNGTQVTRYIFVANGKTYTATYASADFNGNAYPDALSDFNLMVTKTLKFSAN